eukprot:s2258_g3.t1
MTNYIRQSPGMNNVEAHMFGQIDPPAAKSPYRHLPCLRETDLRAEFEHRVYTFQSPPRQLRGLLRNALRVSLEAIRDDAGTDTERDGWKLFLLAPRMLLFRTPGVAHVPPQEFKRRERLFCEGSWTQLLCESVAAAQPAQPVRDAVRAPESPQALTAPPLAPATAETLQALRDPVRRPPEAQVPIHPSVDPMSAAPAQVCKADLLINLRRARRGAAAGPSGCTNEHLMFVMEKETTAELLGHAADRLAAAKVPSDVADALRLGRMVALTKPTGGVRALQWVTSFASWADVIGALRESHPGTLANLVRPFTDLSVPNTPPSAQEAEHASESLRLQGFQTPTWAALVDGAEAGPFAGDDDPSQKVRRGWQRRAGTAVDKRVFEASPANLDGGVPLLSDVLADSALEPLFASRELTMTVYADKPQQRYGVRPDLSKVVHFDELLSRQAPPPPPASWERTPGDLVGDVLAAEASEAAGRGRLTARKQISNEATSEIKVESAGCGAEGSSPWLARLRRLTRCR